MARVDGRKIVGIATVATVSVVGFAQIYLPFWADRDKIRGMAEEEDMPAAAKREMEKQIKQQQQQHEQQQAGSMWKNMKK
mmetsp:Transcript_30656/g.50648  ORF Transcript_30656/g.50648 Transcript_30656/m.50648 type:complete len:80 (-) Transcript_30656:110-349(-)|eukprot:CAMPEP_0119003668 /NCGR_PEP_ID=MMETSP1176-20130426/698_1 /TAXON_ID=265551 /ORGANISM="Synedropsis recta cf, Strain CCMP1620" /LENGTH=79 /DNA_ID=CAMNT_0006955285 /DNA_START=146 /DNA_END=385 /DNA_ORIENTATION=-